jgi:hypothetical protein
VVLYSGGREFKSLYEHINLVLVSVKLNICFSGTCPDFNFQNFILFVQNSFLI